VAGGALLLLVVAVLVVALSGDDLNPPEARSAYDRAAGMLAQGDLDRAEAAFGEVSRKWPQSDFARRATEKLQGIQRDREQDAEAREDMEAI